MLRNVDADTIEKDENAEYTLRFIREQRSVQRLLGHTYIDFLRRQWQFEWKDYIMTVTMEEKTVLEWQRKYGQHALK